MKIDFNEKHELPAHITADVSNLFQLSGGQCTGIIADDVSVIVCDWEGQWGLPYITFAFSLAFIDSEEVTLTDAFRLEDIRTELPGRVAASDNSSGYRFEGMEILHDINGDIPALFGFTAENGVSPVLDDNGNAVPVSGMCYKLYAQGDVVTVIVPDGWE